MRWDDGGLWQQLYELCCITNIYLLSLYLQVVAMTVHKTSWGLHHHNNISFCPNFTIALSLIVKKALSKTLLITTWLRVLKKLNNFTVFFYFYSSLVWKICWSYKIMAHGEINVWCENLTPVWINFLAPFTFLHISLFKHVSGPIFKKVVWQKDNSLKLILVHMWHISSIEMNYPHVCIHVYFNHNLCSINLRHALGVTQGKQGVYRGYATGYARGMSGVSKDTPKPATNFNANYNGGGYSLKNRWAQ